MCQEEASDGPSGDAPKLASAATASLGFSRKEKERERPENLREKEPRERGNLASLKAPRPPPELPRPGENPRSLTPRGPWASVTEHGGPRAAHANQPHPRRGGRNLPIYTQASPTLLVNRNNLHLGLPPLPALPPPPVGFSGLTGCSWGLQGPRPGHC